MSTKGRKFSRRTLLRGAAGTAIATLALPPLEIMFNSNVTAHADGTPLPKRFGIFFWGNGYAWFDPVRGYPDTWTPTGTGTSWTLSEQLAPLGMQEGRTPVSLQDRINVITGLGPKTITPLEPTDPQGQNDPHIRGIANALTSDRPREEDFCVVGCPSIYFQYKRPSIDQVIAQDPRFYGASVPTFRSIEIGISRRRFTQAEPSYNTWEAISQRGPAQPNYPIMGVEELHQKLFGVGLPSEVATRGERAALLDIVSDDARRLRARLGSNDQKRLDAHLEHIHDMQQGFRRSETLCTVPPVPMREGGFDMVDPEPLEEKTVAMAQLLAVALQCDVTRVFTVMLTAPASSHRYTRIGIVKENHAICHEGMDGAGDGAAAWAAIKQITTFNMHCYRLFLEVLANTPDGLGTGDLLDNTLVYGTSELGDGTHRAGLADNEQWPIILAGNAGGAMRTGNHYRKVGGNLSEIHLTMLNAMGLETKQYGFSGAQTTAVIPDLLT